jgi:YggT family protein
MANYRDVQTTQHEEGRQQRLITFKVTQLIWLLLGIFEAVLALRVMFKLIGVNPENTFAAFLYGVTRIFVAPFATLTSAPSAGGMILEISTFIAMIVYLLIAWAIERIVFVAFYRPRGNVSTRQTIIDESSPHSLGNSRTTTTQTPTGSSSTTTTERMNNQPPRSD